VDFAGRDHADRGAGALAGLASFIRKASGPSTSPVRVERSRDTQAPASYDRYAHWPRPLARLALAVLLLLLALAAWAPGYAPPPPPPPKVTVADAAGKAVVKDDDNDLRLYRVIAERVKRGDDYYVAATEEQRANNYPVAPGFTVRLPTLAFLSAWLGTGGLIVLCMLLANPARIFVMIQMRGRGFLEKGVPYGVAIAVAGAMLVLAPAVHKLT